MPKDKLKTIYVCNQCGETSPGGWAAALLVGVEYDDRGCSGGTDQNSSRAVAPVRVTGQTSLTPQKLKNISTTEEKSRTSPASVS